MSAIQELQPYCDAFQGRIREAKDSKGYTLQRLIDESGVPKSAVNNINAGKQVNPLLYNAAALCKVLDLSLDELFGLEKPVDSPEGQQQRIHDMIIDAHILSDGLFRSAGVSVFFVFLVLLVIAALAAIGYALRFLFKK